jgi:Zn-dependent protease
MLLVGADPLQLAILLVTLVVGLSVHEYAHARTAFQLGDLTAYLSGRMTLNPRAHIDPVGALVFLLAGFGWARPVPIDAFRLGRQGTLVVALAGPVSNVLLALIALAPLRLGIVAIDSLGGALLGFFALLNVILAVFNMLPLAPLDGWKVLLGLVPAHTAYRLQELERYGGMVLLLLILVGRIGGQSVLWLIMAPFIKGLLFVVAGPGLAPRLF